MSKRSRSRSQSKSSKHLIKFRAGKITRNPFLNFLRDFRKSHKALKITELTKRGAEIWRTMNDRQKSPYCSLAKQAPVRRVRRSRRRRRRRGRRGRRGRRRAGSVSFGEDEPRRYEDGDSSDEERECHRKSELKIVELAPDSGDNQKHEIND